MTGRVTFGRKRREKDSAAIVIYILSETTARKAAGFD